MLIISKQGRPIESYRGGELKPFYRKAIVHILEQGWKQWIPKKFGHGTYYIKEYGIPGQWGFQKIFYGYL